MPEKYCQVGVSPQRWIRSSSLSLKACLRLNSETIKRVGKRAFGYDVIDGVKVPRDNEQAVIRLMCAMREAGAGYRHIVEWMGAT